MAMTGDGLDGQPVEGVDALDDLADALAPEKDKPDAQDESESEDAEEAEVDEAEEQEDDEEGEDEGEDEKFTIKVDGKDIELTKAELIERAQKGTDYSQKTMAVAKEREAVTAEREQVKQTRAQVEQERAETVARLTAYSQFIESQVGHMPDASMLDYDTAGYLRAKEQYEARKGQLQQAYSEIQRLQDESARQRQAEIAERAEATEKVLADTLPGWNDNTLNELAGYASKHGLTPQTADVAMLSPGFWQMVHAAKAYDAIQAKKAEMKPTEKLTKVAKPSAANQSGKATERAKREAAFQKNPSVDALADLLR
jgi:hypothetical protein